MFVICVLKVFLLRSNQQKARRKKSCCLFPSVVSSKEGRRMRKKKEITMEIGKDILFLLPFGIGWIATKNKKYELILLTEATEKELWLSTNIGC